MSKEKEIIHLINKQMPKSVMQINNLFESDSEIINFKGNKLLFNIDEFSQEDFLREEDAYALGWNIAAGSISDILASGGTPLFYAHSLVVKKTWSKEYIEKLSKGISDVLREYGISFIGGDLGISDIWRYTGTVMGKADKRPLLRSKAEIGDKIFVSGRIGLGNIEAALKLYEETKAIKNITSRFKNYFPIRKEEAAIIQKYSKCCIDTSDGVFGGLNSISQQSKTGFEIVKLPYEKKGLLMSKILSLPRELLFLGECGEYELMFTINNNEYNNFIVESSRRNLKFYEIGEIKKEGVKLLRNKSNSIDLTDFNFSGRSYLNIKEYLKDITNYVKTRRNT